MFQLAQLRKQWPAATATVATLAFILNHYRIAGLENVRLERRSPAEIAQRAANGETWSTSLLSDLNRLQFPVDAALTSAQNAGAGNHALPANNQSPFSIDSPQAIPFDAAEQFCGPRNKQLFESSSSAEHVRPKRAR